MCGAPRDPYSVPSPSVGPSSLSVSHSVTLPACLLRLLFAPSRCVSVCVRRRHPAPSFTSLTARRTADLHAPPKDGPARHRTLFSFLKREAATLFPRPLPSFSLSLLTHDGFVRVCPLLLFRAVLYTSPSILSSSFPPPSSLLSSFTQASCQDTRRPLGFASHPST